MAFPTGSTAKKLTIDSSKVSGSSNLTNFPVLVKDSNIQSAVYSQMTTDHTISATVLTDDVSDTNGNSHTTASISPSANKLVLAVISSGGGAQIGSAGTPTVSGCGITWTLVSNNDYVAVFKGISSSPTTGALSIDLQTTAGNSLRAAWSIIEFTNGKDVVQSATNTNSGTQTGITATLGAFSNQLNATFGTVRRNSTTAITPGTGFTELTEDSPSEGLHRLQTQFKNSNDTSVDWSWSSESASSYAIALEIQSNVGSDIRFTSDSAGTTELPFEIVSLDTVAETAEIWVKVPTVSYNTDTDFYMWYGDVTLTPYAASDTYGSQNVWADYLAVYHFNELVNTTSGGYKDSTANANNGTGVSMSITAPTGFIGERCAEFDGSADRISIPKILNNNTWSVTAYAYLDTFNTSDGAPLFYQGSGSSQLGSVFGLIDEYPSAGDQTAYLRNAGSSIATGNDYNYTTSEWHHYASTANNTAINFYHDGASGGSGTVTTVGTQPNTTGSIGAWYNYADSNRFLDGRIDELRVHDGILTSDWIATEYNNQNSPSTFLTMSDLTNIKSVNGLSYSNIKSINGVAISSIKSVNGVV